MKWLTLAALLFASRAHAAIALMENVNATRNTIKADVTNGRVVIGTTSYTGGISNVGLFVASNVVVGTLANKNANVIYATGTIVTSGVTASTANVSQFIDLTGVSVQPGSPVAGKARFHAFTKQGFTRFEQDNEAATNVTLGRDNVYIAKNTSGGPITRGQPVYKTGSTGATPTVGLAKADSLSTMPSDGMALDDIASNAFGQIIRLGLIENIDTSAFVTASRVYVSTSVAGGLTATRPVSPNYAQRMATVDNSDVGNGVYGVITAPFLGGEESGTTAQNFIAASSITGTHFGDGSHLDNVFTSLNVSSTARNISYQVFDSGSGTYTRASGASQICVQTVGGGGGGGANTTNAGTAGGNTTFGTLTASGGSGGAAGTGVSSTSGSGGAGGAASGGNIANISGGSGGAGHGSDGGTVAGGGDGGSSFFGGAGGGGNADGAGTPGAGSTAATNSGSGGGGAGGKTASSGAGGGAGGFVWWCSTSTASASYSIGAAGTGGAAGVAAGGNGGSGKIIVYEYYPALGPQGATGATGAAGSNGSNGVSFNGGWTATAPSGTVYLTTATNAVLIQSSLTVTGIATSAGITDASEAEAGKLGEVVYSSVSGFAFPASGNTGDATSITLSAGDWDISAIGYCSSGSGFTAFSIAVTTISGNSFTNFNIGDNVAYGTEAVPDESRAIPGLRSNYSVSKVHYLKLYAVYAVGTPTFNGRISARRVR